MVMNIGNYVVMNEWIDTNPSHNRDRFLTQDEAVKQAKKHTKRDKRDYYVAKMVAKIEQNTDDDETVVTEVIDE